MISVRNLTKVYKLGKKSSAKEVVALNNVSVDFPDKGLVFLLGKSGSGKSTLLNSIGGLDTFDSGEIIIKGKSSKNFKQSDFDSYRNTFIGFIFQEYNVLEEFTVGKNLSLALELQGKNASKEEVNKLLEQVDLEGYYKRKPNQLSGGQKQRVAIARALIKDPEIIMADEPTGALDSNTGKQVMDTLKKLSKEKLVIIVSHDREFAEIYGDRVIELKDGQIIKDETKTEVIAQKSESGVSFIDDKIIHIKKGQQVSKEDLEKINEMIVKNTNNEDTIISFDQKSNTDVKKSAFITDDGNREVFKTTSKEDIKRINHDPKDFKMIKSKLRFKDSFKMGASSLKHKPIRLIFTILLSVFAFGMFGVVNTMSSFNRADSVYETLQELDIKNIAINKRIDYDNYNTYKITQKEFEKFQADNPDYKLNQVIYSDAYYNVSGLSHSSYDTSYSYGTLRQQKISGLMAIDESIQTSLALQLVEGRLPTASNEICISYNIMETLKTLYLNVNSLESLQTVEFNIDNDWNKDFTIVGIIKDDTNLARYTDVKSNPSTSQERTLYEELSILLKCSLINMCYVTTDTFNSYSLTQPNSSNNRTYLYPYTEDSDDYGGGYSYYPAYSSSLTDKQAIVPKSLLINELGFSESELDAKISEGLKVNFSYQSWNYEKYHAFTLDVVDYSSNGNNEIVLSTEFYNENFRGPDFFVTRLTGTESKDKALVSYFENYGDKLFDFNVQFQSSPVLDNFGGMIEDMAKILLWVGVGLAVFAGLMLMNFISTSISYKKREIGVLRAIGARSKDVFSIFFSESFIICMVNFIISAIGTGIVCNIINSSIASDLGITLTVMMFGMQQILLLFSVALFVAFISTFLPVYKFAKKNPIDSINNR